MSSLNCHCQIPAPSYSILPLSLSSSLSALNVCQLFAVICNISKRYPKLFLMAICTYTALDCNRFTERKREFLPPPQLMPSSSFEAIYSRAKHSRAKQDSTLSVFLLNLWPKINVIYLAFKIDNSNKCQLDLSTSLSLSEEPMTLLQRLLSFPWQEELVSASRGFGKC